MTGETVTIVEPGSRTDERGNIVADWSEDVVATTTVGDALWAPARASVAGGESHAGGRQGVVDEGALYLRPGVAIAATWRVVLRGLVYEVDGPPGVWDGGGVEVALRRVTG